jgi:hypothetical protein
MRTIQALLMRWTRYMTCFDIPQRSKQSRRTYCSIGIYLTVFVTFCLTWATREPFSLYRANEELQVVLREGARWYDEVTASFMQSLQHCKDVHITFLINVRYEMGAVCKNLEWKNEPIYGAHKNFTADTIKSIKADINIAVTCGRDMRDNMKAWEANLADTEAIVFCVAHEAGSFFEDNENNLPQFGLIHRWMKANRLRSITLSPHTTMYLDEHFEEQSVTQDNFVERRKTHTYQPIFLIDNILAQESEAKKKQGYFIVQDDIEPGRRDYATALESFAKEADKLNSMGREFPRIVVMGEGATTQMDNKLKDTISFKSVCRILDIIESYTVPQQSCLHLLKRDTVLPERRQQSLTLSSLYVL